MGQTGGGGLRLNPDYSAERLVREVFANDRCETIFNIRPIGRDADGIGYFEGDSSIVGFDRGIVLSTGKIVDAAGPNNATNRSTKLAGETSDPDLDIATRNGVFDRSGIEFDFVPLESTVVFRYVFASEEYCEYVGARFNDIFGFFVSGPGYDGPYSGGGVNVARVPGKNDPVTVNTINDQINKQYFLDNNPPDSPGACRSTSGNSPRLQSIQFDGQTTVLTATLNVQPCATYHIRLVIADISDDRLDSAVFLEAGSFDLGASATLGPKDGSDAPLVLYEGCKPATLRIKRGPDSNPERDQTVIYRLGSGSVATDSTDFEAGGGRVVIPAGQSFIDVPITAREDDLAEGEEEAWLVLNVPCACYSDSVRVLVRDTEPLGVYEDEPFLYCRAVGARVSIDIRGGVPPYAYEWSFGSNEPNPIIRDSLPGVIGLRLTDACGQVVEWESATEEAPAPTINFPTPKLAACWDDTLDVPVELTGLGPFTFRYVIDGTLQAPVTMEAGDVWPVRQGGDYQVIAITDGVCTAEVDERFRTDFYRPVLNTSYTDPTCFEAEDGTISGRHLTTVPPYRYTLDGVPTNGLAIGDLPAGTYTVTVADALGCSDTATVALLDPEPINEITIDCKQLRRPPLTIGASGGVPPYAYSTDDTTYTEGRAFWLKLDPGNYYELHIRDARGCEIVQPEFYYPKAAAFPIQLPNFIPQRVNESVKIELDYRVPENQVFSYNWQPSELFDCPTCPNPTLTSPFTQDVNLIIRDIYGCTDSLTTYVAVDGRQPIYVPNVFTPDGDGNNDYVAIFGNIGIVERILSFQVYTRWGEQVYSDGNFAPNSARRGWDGMLNGRPALPGAYMWVAEVRLFDGQIQREGGITVLVAR